MQIIYSHTMQADNVDLRVAETELGHSITKAHELYHRFLLLPVELKQLALRRMENNKTKLRPTDSDLNPNTRFVDNRLIAELERNAQLMEYAEKNRTTWTSDEDTLGAVFQKMCESDLYSEYMQQSGSNFETDAAFVNKLLTKVVPQMDFLFDALEEECVYWNDEAEFAISIAAKTLKSFDGTNGAEVQLLPRFKDAEDEEFASTLLRRTLALSDETLKLIKQFSVNWDTERVAALDVLIITMSVAEMTSFVHIPIRVTLNEYIELSKFYSTPKSHVYINGILEKIVRFLVDEKRIHLSQITTN